MQNLKVINRSLKQQGIKCKKRKLILYAYQQQYDQLIQYADLYKKTRIFCHLHFEDELLPALREMGYDLIFDEGIKYMVKK